MSTPLEGVQTVQTWEKHSFQIKYNKICASLAVPQNVVLLAVLLHEMFHEIVRQMSNKKASFKTSH